MKLLVVLITLPLLFVGFVESFPSSVKYLIDNKYLDAKLWKSSPAITQALRKLQKKSGLKITGQMNSDTAEVMKLRKCGIQIQMEEYVEEGSKWNTSELTYRIGKYTHDMSKYKVDKITARSFKFWSDVSPLTFTQVKNKTAHVDIEILFVIGDHGDGLNFDGVNGKFAHAFFPQYGGDAHFDDAEFWDETNNYEDSVNLLQVMTHELGHSLGLKHSEVHAAVMFKFYDGYNPNFKLHADDIAGIQALYGGPNDIYTTPTPTTLAPYDRCGDGTLDAISIVNNGRYYAFRRGYTMLLSSSGDMLEKPRRIGHVFPQVPDNLDAVVTWPSRVKTINKYPYFHRVSGRTFFFKGDNYWTRKSDGKITGPKSIECGFEGVPSNVDAVFMDGSDTIFVKGDLFYRYIRGEESLAPVQRSASKFKHMPSNIDAAFYHPHFRHLYFFSGKQYYRKRRFGRKLSRGYPKSIGKSWLLC